MRPSLHIGATFSVIALILAKLRCVIPIRIHAELCCEPFREICAQRRHVWRTHAQRLWSIFFSLSQSTHLWTEPYKAVATQQINRYNNVGNRGEVEALCQRALFHCAEAARLHRVEATNPRVWSSGTRRHRLQWVPYGWVASYGDICGPNRDYPLPVERQGRNRSPSNRRQAQEQETIDRPYEVLTPDMLSRVEQWDNRTALRILVCSLGRFAAVAVKAC
jgi:hypothetical protein